MAQDDSAGRSFDLPEAFLDYLTSTPYSAEEYHALLQSPEEPKIAGVLIRDMGKQGIVGQVREKAIGCI